MASDKIREAIERALPCVDTCNEITGRHMPWCPGYWRDDVDEKVAPLLAAAQLKGWRAGREAALSAALDVIFSAFEPRPALRQTIEGDMVRAIRALPEPGPEGGE